MGHGCGHGDEAVHAAEAHGDLEKLGHLFPTESDTRGHESIGMNVDET